MGLHGDGAPTTKTEGLFTISWSSDHATGNTSQTRNVYAVLPKTAVDVGTLLAVWDYLAWACISLLAGRIPPRDHNGNRHLEAGRKIAKGWRFAMVQVRGDWEYSEVLKLPRWGAVPRMCWVCCAKQGEGLPNNQLWTTVEDGGWRSAPTISHEQSLANLRAANLEAHLVFRIVCLRIEGVMTDVLRILDQGCTCHVIGNVLWELRRVFGGINMKEQVGNIEADIKAWHKANNVPLELRCELTVERLRTSKDWPKLKAKAATTRHLIECTSQLASRHNSGSTHDRRRLAVVQILRDFYNVCATEGGAFPRRPSLSCAR